MEIRSDNPWTCEDLNNLYNLRAPICPIFPIYSYIFLSFLYFPILFKIPIFSYISEKLSILRVLCCENLPFDLTQILFHFTNFLSTKKLFCQQPVRGF